MSEHEDNQGMSAVVRYTIVAVVLGIFTAIEVAVLYPPLVQQGDLFKISLLVGLSILKFVAVVALFMHLWHDPFLYTAIFGAGFVLAVGTMVALIAVTSVHPPAPGTVPPMTEDDILRIQDERRHGGGHGGGEHATPAGEHSFLDRLDSYQLAAATMQVSL